MNIIDKFLNKMMTTTEKHRDKHKQKVLIKANDDNMVVEALPEDKDNSGINIEKVVKSMDDPESMIEVVKNNLGEIIEQNTVRDTMQNIPDEAVVEILEENKKELKEEGKIAFAIQAIEDNDQKLEVTQENLDSLTVMETATILNSLEEEAEEKRAKKIENKKIKATSEQILRLLVKYGHVSEIDIDQMVSTLKDESSKLVIAKLCLAKIAGYDECKRKNITSRAKTKFTYYLLKITNVEMSEKHTLLKDCTENNWLDVEESKLIECDLIKEKARLEKLERERKIGMGARD